MHQVRQIHQPPIFDMTTFQGLTATQWRNRINDYNPGMFTKEFLKNKTAKELAQIQNGKSYKVSSKRGKPKPISTMRAKLEAIKKEKMSTTKKKENEEVLNKCSDSVLELLHALSKPTSEVGTTVKGQTADMAKKLIAVLQFAEANNKPKPNNKANPKAKAKVQEWDPDSDDEEEESDESEEE
jgi:hypothetical protein